MWANLLSGLIFAVGFGLLAYSAVAFLASMKRQLRSSSGAGSIATLGNALQELDRLVARPSVEHQIETENRVVNNEKSIGGE